MLSKTFRTIVKCVVEGGMEEEREGEWDAIRKER